MRQQVLIWKCLHFSGWDDCALFHQYSASVAIYNISICFTLLEYPYFARNTTQIKRTNITMGLWDAEESLYKMRYTTNTNLWLSYCSPHNLWVEIFSSLVSLLCHNFMLIPDSKSDFISHKFFMFIIDLVIILCVCGAQQNLSRQRHLFSFMIAQTVRKNCTSISYHNFHRYNIKRTPKIISLATSVARGQWDCA